MTQRRKGGGDEDEENFEGEEAADEDLDTGDNEDMRKDSTEEESDD